MERQSIHTIRGLDSRWLTHGGVTLYTEIWVPLPAVLRVVWGGGDEKDAVMINN